MAQSIEKQCVARIYGHGRGWVFSKKDFADIGPRTSIDWALYRLESKGTIRRVIRGIYDYPKVGKLTTSPLGPGIHEVANALARKHGWTIEPSGETALNILGLSTQVPGRYLFYSDGPNRRYMVESLTLEFRRRALKDIRMKLSGSVLLVQALKALGKERVDSEIIAKLRAAINPEERLKIAKDTQYVTDWVHQAVKRACIEE